MLCSNATPWAQIEVTVLPNTDCILWAFSAAKTIFECWDAQSSTFLMEAYSLSSEQAKLQEEFSLSYVHAWGTCRDSRPSPWEFQWLHLPSLLIPTIAHSDSQIAVKISKNAALACKLSAASMHSNCCLSQYCRSQLMSLLNVICLLWGSKSSRYVCVVRTSTHNFS